MKTKDLQVGVVYSRLTTERKGVIVSMAGLERPEGGMVVGRPVKVKSATGANAGFIVVTAAKEYPDELLLEQAAKLAVPVAGEVWPFKPHDNSIQKYNHRLHGYRESDFVMYSSPAFESHAVTHGKRTYKVNARVEIWVARQFDCTWEEVENREVAKEEAYAEALRNQVEFRRQRSVRSRAAIAKVHALGIGSGEDDTLRVHSHSENHGGSVSVNTDALEKLLSLIPEGSVWESKASSSA